MARQQSVQLTFEDPIVASVAVKLAARSARGLSKYGTLLTRTDLTTLDWLSHLQEEVLDASNYLEVLIKREEARVQEEARQTPAPIQSATAGANWSPKPPPSDLNPSLLVQTNILRQHQEILEYMSETLLALDSKLTFLENNLENLASRQPLTSDPATPSPGTSMDRIILAQAASDLPSLEAILERWDQLEKEAGSSTTLELRRYLLSTVVSMLRLTLQSTPSSQPSEAQEAPTGPYGQQQDYAKDGSVYEVSESGHYNREEPNP